MAFVEKVLFEKNNLMSFRWKTRTLLTAAISSNYNRSLILSFELNQLRSETAIGGRNCLP